MNNRNEIKSSREYSENINFRVTDFKEFPVDDNIINKYANAIKDIINNIGKKITTLCSYTTFVNEFRVTLVQCTKHNVALVDIAESLLGKGDNELTISFNNSEIKGTLYGGIDTTEGDYDVLIDIDKIDISALEDTMDTAINSLMFRYSYVQALTKIDADIEVLKHNKSAKMLAMCYQYAAITALLSEEIYKGVLHSKYTYIMLINKVIGGEKLTDPEQGAFLLGLCTLFLLDIPFGNLGIRDTSTADGSIGADIKELIDRLMSDVELLYNTVCNLMNNISPSSANRVSLSEVNELGFRMNAINRYSKKFSK